MAVEELERERVSENEIERALDGVSERVVHVYYATNPTVTLCGLPRGSSGHENCPHVGKPVNGALYCPGCGRPLCAFCQYAGDQR